MNKTLIDLLHDITQADYQVQFCGDFENMIRLEFRKEYDPDFYEHEHLGFPDGDMKNLEKSVIDSLNAFKEEKGIK
jgi:hypothetical protein